MTRITPRKRADGATSYRVQFRPPGKQTPTTETFDSAEAAQKFIDLAGRVGWAAAQDVRQATTSSRGTPTLATWFERHLDDLAASVTPGTIYGYRREAARTWLPHLGAYPIDMITRQQITRWVAWQRKQETLRSANARRRAAAEGTTPPPVQLVSTKTIANAHGLLSSVLQSAATEYGCPNPAVGVTLPSDRQADGMAFLTPAEFDQLLTAIPAHHQPAIAFLAGSGCRWGEMTALVAADFDLAAEVPVVRVSKAWKKDAAGRYYLGSPKTRRGVRTVTLDDTTVAAVRHLIDNRPADQLVFQALHGGRLHSQNFQPRVWQPAVRASGITKRPRIHDLRHSHASWLIGAGVPLPVIQYRLGHESIKTTVDRYGHLMPGAGDLAAAAIGRVLAGVTAAPLTGELMP